MYLCSSHPIFLIKIMIALAIIIHSTFKFAYVRIIPNRFFEVEKLDATIHIFINLVTFMITYLPNIRRLYLATCLLLSTVPVTYMSMEGIYTEGKASTRYLLKANGPNKQTA